MNNPNQAPVLTFEQKRVCEGMPAHIISYDEVLDQFVIIADYVRYYEEGRDTAFYDFDAFRIPAMAVGAFASLKTDDPNDYVGLYIVIPFS